VPGITYIGSEVSAAGLALVGVRTFACAPQAREIAPLLEAARSRGDLILLGAAHAREVGDQLARIVSAAALPPVLVAGSVEDEAMHADSVVARARAVLGLSR